MEISMRHSQKGFTIVELLIVIVVIGILAAITIVAYNGVQNRANDTAVQSDLKAIGGKFMAFQATEGVLPTTSADLTPMNIRVSTSAYGNHYIATGKGYNMAYCYDYTTKSNFVIVATSRSGNTYVFRDGGVKVGVGPMQTVLTTCANNGLPTGVSYIWLYAADVWQYGFGS